MKLRETEIATGVMTYLQEMGWDCYPEAIMDSSHARADIAAVRGGCLWVIECKVSFTLALLEQADEWIGNANIVSIAVPNLGRSYVGRQYCEFRGIGILYYTEYGTLSETLRPRFHRDRAGNSQCKKNRESLHPDMKRAIPGSPSGESYYSTPWRRTLEEATKYVKNNPGCTMKEMVKGINHHYSSAVSAGASLLHWIPEKTKIRIDTSSKPYRLYVDAA